MRETPQAFSHFTYQVSGGACCVVDVQGVGNLLTDPQIHTRDGRDFGAGNRGAAGIADFISTHDCNAICRKMKLDPSFGGHPCAAVRP